MKILQPLEAFPAATTLYRVAIFRLYAGLWTIYDHYTQKPNHVFYWRVTFWGSLTQVQKQHDYYFIRYFPTEYDTE